VTGPRQRRWVGGSHDDVGKEIGVGGIVRLKGCIRLESLCLDAMDWLK
jgi:hypothetical protein